MKILQVLLLVVGFLFSGIGLLCLAGGTYFYFSTSAFIHRAITADGTVTALNRASLNGDTYAPVVEFSDSSGQTRTFTSRLSSSPPAYSVGQHVQVLYESGHPDSAVIHSFFSLWLIPFIFFVVGIVPLLVGLACLAGWWVAGRYVKRSATLA